MFIIFVFSSKWLNFFLFPQKINGLTIFEIQFRKQLFIGWFSFYLHCLMQFDLVSDHTHQTIEQCVSSEKKNIQNI